MTDNRGRFERVAAKAIHRLGLWLTPNTFYWMGKENPFGVIEGEYDRVAGAAAVEHLARITHEHGKDTIEGTVTGLRIDGTNTGDWKIIVHRTAMP